MNPFRIPIASLPRPAALAAVWLGLFSLLAPPVRAQDTDDPVSSDKVVHKATPHFVTELLDNLGLEYKDEGKNNYLIQPDGIRILVIIESDGDLMLYHGITGLHISLARVNEWNRKHRLSRAYLDDSNDPVLESDLDFTGGVTLEALKSFIKVFRQSAKTYNDFMSQ